MRQNSSWQLSTAAVVASIWCAAVSPASGQAPFRADPDPRAGASTARGGAASPAGTLQDAQQSLHEYRIGSGDVLGVEVWKEPDALNPSMAVRPDGRISLPMLGEVNVAD